MQAFDIPVRASSSDGGVSGTVPATLSLTLGAPAAFAPFSRASAKDYTAGTTANVISTAGDATLSVADPSADRHRPSGQRHVLAPAGAAGEGHEPAGTGARRAVGGSANPTTLLTYARPVSQRPGRDRRSGSASARTTRCAPGTYSKTLTFTLSTTHPVEGRVFNAGAAGLGQP